MNITQQHKILSTCIEGINTTKKNCGLASDCPFIKMERSSKHREVCDVYIIGSEKTNSSYLSRGFRIGILDLKPSFKPFYSAIIPEYSLVGIYRSIKNKEYKGVSNMFRYMLPQKYEEKYLEHVICEFGDWLHQKKMITKEERDAHPTEDKSLG